MADYQEYRRRILHRRWRRVFIIVALLALVALLSAIGILWKVLHRERVDTALSQNTILEHGQLPAGAAAPGADAGGQHRDRAGLPHGSAAGQRSGGKKLVCTGQFCG